MRFNIASAVVAMLLVAACGRQQGNSEGNGPGNADGAGGRADPVTAPAPDLGQPAPSGETTQQQPATPPAE